MNTASIVTLTLNPALDLFIEVDELLPDTKLRCAKPLVAAGGGGITVSRALRRLGGDSLALFAAGGATGEQVAILLERESIKTDVIYADAATRECMHVRDGRSGKEFRLVPPGAKLGIVEWQRVLRALLSIEPTPDYVVASGSLPPGVPVDFFEKLAMIAHQRRFRLIVDSSCEPLRHLGKGTFLLKGNEKEIACAANHASPRALIESGTVEAIVMTSGAAGATLFDRKETRRYEAPSVDVASRMGAGDSMTAGLVLALARKWTLGDAVQYGVAAGTATVTVPSHQLCSLEMTDRLYAKQAVLV